MVPCRLFPSQREISFPFLSCRQVGLACSPLVCCIGILLWSPFVNSSRPTMSLCNFSWAHFRAGLSDLCLPFRVRELTGNFVSCFFYRGKMWGRSVSAELLSIPSRSSYFPYRFIYHDRWALRFWSSAECTSRIRCSHPTWQGPRPIRIGWNRWRPQSWRTGRGNVVSNSKSVNMMRLRVCACVLGL